MTKYERFRTLTRQNKFIRVFKGSEPSREPIFFDQLKRLNDEFGDVKSLPTGRQALNLETFSHLAN